MKSKFFMLHCRLGLESQKPSSILHNRNKDVSQHVLGLLFPLKNMVEQGSLWVNEQSLFKLLGLAVNTSAFTHMLDPQAGQGKLEKLCIACFKSEAKSLCCAYPHLPYRSQRDWK